MRIKMPSPDFRGILKMSLFHCSYFTKQLPNGFPSRIAWSIHLGCCSTFGKRKNTQSLVHGSHNPARKTIRHSFKMAYSVLYRWIFFCQTSEWWYVRNEHREKHIVCQRALLSVYICGYCDHPSRRSLHIVFLEWWSFNIWIRLC